MNCLKTTAVCLSLRVGSFLYNGIDLIVTSEDSDSASVTYDNPDSSSTHWIPPFAYSNVHGSGEYPRQHCRVLSSAAGAFHLLFFWERSKFIAGSQYEGSAVA